MKNMIEFAWHNLAVSEVCHPYKLDVSWYLPETTNPSIITTVVDS